MRKALMSGLFGAVSTALLGTAAAQAAVAHSPLADPTAVVANAPDSQAVSFELFLPLRNEADLDALVKQQNDPSSPNYHQWLTPAQFAQRFGPTALSMSAARSALASAGFSVTASHSRSMTVSGSVAAVNRAFAATLKSVTHANGQSQLVSATGVTLPAALKAQGATVAAFANKPNLHVDSHLAPVSTPGNRASDHGPYWFTDLRQAYNYPALNAKLPTGKLLDGSGVSVAIVMSSDALDSDVAAAFNHEKYTAISGRPVPKIIHVAINGGCDPGNPVACDAFDESSLDTQQVLGGAPGAKVTLLNIPTLSDQNIIDAYLTIVEQNTYDIVSSSFGGCELDYSAAYNGGVDNTGVLRTYDTLFKQGNAEGITFVASSGDQGGLSCPSVNYFTGASGQATFVPSVEFPANDPAVTGVGGGNLVTTAPTTANPLNSAYVSENAYGDPDVPYDPDDLGRDVYGGYWGAGGGPSTVFSAPSYQSLVTTGSSARTVPDVGMQVGGCPSGLSQTCGPERSSVYVYINGVAGGLIGTSVAAPEFAGALALYVQTKGRQGNVNTFLYQQSAAQIANSSNAADAFYNKNAPGFDGKWSNTYPSSGYDYLYGNGSPRVRYLFGFTNLPAAGEPQTPSNP